MKPNKAYIGDAVYVEADNWGGVVLTTSDGLTDTNRIVLEPDVIDALEDYLKAIRLVQELAEKDGDGNTARQSE